MHRLCWTMSNASEGIDRLLAMHHRLILVGEAAGSFAP